METIDSQAMTIRYAPPSFYGPIIDESALPVQNIVFDPPLQDPMDARKRLIALSEMSTTENARFAQAIASHPLWDQYNMEVFLCVIDAIVMHPIALVGLGLLAVLMAGPIQAEHAAQMKHGHVLLLAQSTIHAHAYTSFLILFPVLVLLTLRLVSGMSRKWTNAAPIPSDLSRIPSWAFRTLFLPTLPRLDSESWKEETVVITGGARGLGAVLALRLSQKGARVITLDVTKTTVKHSNLVAYHCDLSKRNEVFSVIRNILYRHGPPSILINNAAIRNGHPLLDVSVDDIARLMDTNTMAHFWTLKEFLPAMVEKKRGHIVTVSSTMGQTSVAQMTDYVASKHAIVGLHESLRFELDSIYKTPFVRTTLVTTGHLQETSMFSGIHYNAFARFFAPTVSTKKVADAVVDALDNQESRTVAIPWFAAVVPVLRLLPSFMRDGVQALLGANHSMTTAPRAAPSRENK